MADRRSKAMERAPNSVRDANIVGLSCPDEAAPTQLVEDYFLGDGLESSDDDSAESEEEEGGALGFLGLPRASEASVDFFSDQDDDDDDQPPIATNEPQRVNHLLGEAIVCCRPMTDLCWECQKNNLINRTINCEEDRKTATLQRQEAHLQHVKEERTSYKKQVADAKVVVADGELKLGLNNLCSRECVMHYSFDFAQQVHYPANPLQPGQCTS